MKKSIRLLFFLFVLLLNIDLIAQPLPPNPGGGGGPGSPICWPPTCIPIDGGIGFLLAAAIAFGGKKLYDKKQ